MTEHDLSPRHQRLTRILWIALLTSVVAYALVATIARPKAPQVDDPDLLPLIFTLVAASSLVASAVVPRLLARQGAPYLTYCVLRWAMAESVAVLGVVLLFMGFDPRVGYAFLAVCGLAILLQPPGGRDYERFRDLTRR